MAQVPMTPAATAQVEVKPGGELTPIQAAERKLMKSVLWGVGIAVPVCMGIWVVIMVLALSAADWDESWASALCIAVVVGAFAGAFFGGWAGALAASHDLDQADKHGPDAH